MSDRSNEKLKPYKKTPGRNKRWCLVVMLITSLLMTACGSDTIVPVLTSQTSSQPSIPVTETPVQSGPLRIWITPFDSPAQPLTDSDRTHRALYRLLYQGLFHITAEEEALPELCRDWSINLSGNILTIELHSNIRFHDGSRLDADDVQASFRAIADAGSNSPYARDIAGIRRMQVIGTYTLRVELDEPDVFALHRLTFPVLPADWLNEEYGDRLLPPGSGRFAFQEVKGDGVLRLAAVSTVQDDRNVKEILAVPMESITEAMEALQDDQIDLVESNADWFEWYRYRQDLTVNTYPGFRYLFVALNGTGQRSLSDPDWYRLVRLYVNLAMRTETVQHLPVSLSPAPVIQGGLLAYGWQQTVQDDPVLQNPDLLQGLSIDLLFPEQDSVRAEIAQQIATLLEAAGANVIVNRLEPELYRARLEAGSYDIALCEAVTTSIPDPSWYYLPQEPMGIPGMEWFPDPPVMTEAYESAQERLLEFVRQSSSDPDWNIFRQALLSGTESSPFVGIGFRSEGVLTGQRILKQLASHRNNPYEGIEEVYVWSGS